MEHVNDKENPPLFVFYNVGTIIVVRINGKLYSISWIRRFILGFFQVSGYLLRQFCELVGINMPILDWLFNVYAHVTSAYEHNIIDDERYYIRSYNSRETCRRWGIGRTDSDSDSDDE